MDRHKHLLLNARRVGTPNGGRRNPPHGSAYGFCIIHRRDHRRNGSTAAAVVYHSLTVSGGEGTRSVAGSRSRHVFHTCAASTADNGEGRLLTARRLTDRAERVRCALRSDTPRALRFSALRSPG